MVKLKTPNNIVSKYKIENMKHCKYKKCLKKLKMKNK